MTHPFPDEFEYQYLVPKRNKRATHIWTGSDTMCHMVSSGGLRATHKYEVVDVAESHPNHQRICAMCNNMAIGGYLYPEELMRKRFPEGFVQRDERVKIPFSQATEKQLKELWQRLVDEAIQWADDHDIRTLSAAQEWNLYNALDDAVHHYRERSK